MNKKEPEKALRTTGSNEAGADAEKEERLKTIKEKCSLCSKSDRCMLSLSQKERCIG